MTAKHGEEYEITHGEFTGWIHRSIVIPTGTGDASFIPNQDDSGEKIDIGPMDVTVVGTAGLFGLKASGGRTIHGDFEIGTSGTTLVMADDGRAGISTQKVGEHVLFSRSVEASARGYCVYRRVAG